MKQTINANIGSMAFTLDQDAYDALKRYLERVEQALPADEKESIGDIERGIAEILREKTPSPLRVVSLEDVKAVIARMGEPEAFSADGKCPDAPSEQASSTRPRLYRSRSSRSIAGVCGGLAAYFAIDATLLRLVTLFLILFGGLSIWVYVILWIVISEEPVHNINLKP